MTMDDFPLVSSIVVSYNGKHFLGECFSSLQNLDFWRGRVKEHL